MVALNQHNIMCSLMDVLGNSSLFNLFILSLNTEKLQGVVGCCGLFLEHAMGRENMMG
jgi:hypothetical protein